MRRRAAAGILLLCAAAAGGGCSDPSKELSDSREALRSWSATVDTIAAGWSDRLLPRRFAKTALQAAADELRKESRNLRETEKKLPAAAAELQRATELEARVSRLRDAVERGARTRTDSPEPHR